MCRPCPQFHPPPHLALRKDRQKSPSRAPACWGSGEKLPPALRPPSAPPALASCRGVRAGSATLVPFHAHLQPPAEHAAQRRVPRTDGSHICPPTSHGGEGAQVQGQCPAERAQMRWKGKSRILARSGSCRQIPPSHRAARSGTAGPLGEPSLPRLTAASRAGSAAHPQPEPPRAPGDSAGRRQRRGATGGCTAVTSCRSPPGRDGQVCRLRGQPRPP